jgi:hypothetical protein
LNIIPSSKSFEWRDARAYILGLIIAAISGTLRLLLQKVVILVCFDLPAISRSLCEKAAKGKAISLAKSFPFLINIKKQFMSDLKLQNNSK